MPNIQNVYTVYTRVNILNRNVLSNVDLYENIDGMEFDLRAHLNKLS